MTITLADVVKYSPTFLFHPDEKYFPCAIEHICAGGTTLNKQTFRSPQQIDGQFTGTPALAYYRNRLVMVYTGHHSSQLYATTSKGGLNWKSPVQIPNQGTSVPALAVYNPQLFMVYSGATNSQLYWSSSTDGLSWTVPAVIPNQFTQVPAIVAYQNSLFLIYSDTGLQLWQSQGTQKSDGTMSWTSAVQINGQFTGVPALSIFKSKILMVYSAQEQSQLYTSQYNGTVWTQPEQIKNQGTSIPALTVVGDWAIIVYSGATGTQFYASHSADGTTWSDPITIDNQSGSVPAAANMRGDLWVTYTDSGGSGQLYVTSAVNGDIVPHAPIEHPLQTDLKNCGLDSGWWLEIAESQWTGMSISNGPPLYYAVQTNPDRAKITYVVLYAFQGGQTIRAMADGHKSFDCKVWNTGTHAGDLERVSVYLMNNGDGTYTYEGTQFEAHGDSYPSKDTFNTRSELQLDTFDSTPGAIHPVVLVGLNGHGCWNPKNHDMTSDNRIVLESNIFAEIGISSATPQIRLQVPGGGPGLYPTIRPP